MGLLKRKKQDDAIHFSKWLDHVLQHEIPNGIKAYNFNLYEGTHHTYNIELIGSDEFNEDDDDFACSDYFSSELYTVKRTIDIKNWEDGLNYIIQLVKEYLQNGQYKDILKKAMVVSVGFVDGDLTIIYKK